MNQKTFGIIAIIFGILVLYSSEEFSWIISSIFVGVGCGLCLWKDKTNDKEK
tara:strand:- start:599 stop:754 length:156 start_codon:yes stop_codon:yes gene_type:complete